MALFALWYFTLLVLGYASVQRLKTISRRHMISLLYDNDNKELNPESGTISDLYAATGAGSKCCKLPSKTTKEKEATESVAAAKNISMDSAVALL